MADNYQDALIKAIETISKSQVDNLATDKTVTATIISCSNLLTNEYKVSYNGGIMYVYGSEGKTYTENSSVYVLVPEGDFTKKKIIIDSATYKEDDQNISFISSIMSDYNLLGKNTLYEQDGHKIYPAGLNSYLSQDRLLLYQRGLESSAENGNLLSLDAESLNTYMKQSDALMVEAKFKTNLPKEHRVRGKYWLNIVIAIKDGDKTFNEFENCLPNNIKVSEDENLKNKKALDSLQQLWQVENETPEALSKAIEKTTELKNLYNNRIKENKDEDDSRTKQALTDIVILLQNLSNIKTGGMIAQSKTIFEEMWSSKYEVPQVKYQTFTLSSDEMTGDPHRFYNWANQYIFCPINTSNFLYIESIVFQSYDFIDKDNIPMATLKGDNIFVQNIEIYGVKKISATNGDFKLQIGTPQGAIFHSYNEITDGLEILGKVTKANVDITSSTNFYWFVEDVNITSESNFFNYYAGTGWRWLQTTKGNKERISVTLEDCPSFENHYKCVAVYKQEVVLKADVTIYNNASKRKVEIQSNIGTSFSFDRGIPILTCYVNGRAENFEAGEEHPHDDKLYKFVWSVTEDAKETVTYNKTEKELEDESDKLKNKLKKGEFEGSDEKEKQTSKKALIKSIEIIQQQKIALQVENLKIDKNILQYPVSSINNVANIKCGVYLKDTEDGEYYCVGIASIDLQNNSEATPTEYYILITNGDQVFQYSESGVAPNNERYTDPLEVKPLECHFYDPTGLEVNENTYELKWRVPLTDTMIVTPTQNMIENPATGNQELNITPKKEWYQGRVFPLEIQQSYNYFALNNQVTAIVTYDGREYTQDSTLYFTKIGENGTNGTDIVCKITPNNNSTLGLFALELRKNAEVDGGYDKKWNTGEIVGQSTPLDIHAYNRGSELSIESNKTRWTIAGGGIPKKNNTEFTATRSKHLNILDTSSSSLVWEDNNNTTSNYNRFNNQIVKAEVKIKDEITSKYNSYYAYYPVPVIKYNNNVIKNIYIDNTKTLKYITYNADGRNPLFNKNQGIFIKIEGNPNTNYFINWSVQGGANDISSPYSTTSSLKLYHYKEGIYYEEQKRKQETPSNIINQATPESQKGQKIKSYELYIAPADVYSGEYCNNLIRGKIYPSEDDYKNNSANPDAEIYIPICLTLNTYGLASLNAWDGTHIEINEDENYILAPQIGAGEKDNENKFTGIVMGQAKFYDKTENTGEPEATSSIGLLGYAKGKQSIWLDAETGKAVFGLPENKASQNNCYNEGRIELVPGGISSIGNWKIGSRLLYNIIDDTNNNLIQDHGYNDAFTPQLTTGELVWDDKTNSYYLNEDDPDKALTVKSAYSISPQGRGIIISAEPAYISIKGSQLTIKDAQDRNRNIRFSSYEEKSKTSIVVGNGEERDYRNGKSELYVGDSLELQLDANRASLFSIMQHTKKRDKFGNFIDKNGNKTDEKNAPWVRIQKVGIDAYGRFYTNALKDSAVGMAPGYVAAFGNAVSSHIYSGLTLETGDNAFAADTIFKVFTETEKSGAGTLYISGSNNSDDEYARPMHLYGKEITLFASGGKTSTKSENKIAISSTEFYGGTSTNYIRVNSKGFYGINGMNKIEVTPQHFYGGNSNYRVEVNATGIYGGNGRNHINIQSSGSDITTNSSLNVTSVGRYSNNVGNTKIISTPSTISILTGGATKEATQGIKISAKTGVKLNTSDSCYLDMSGGAVNLCALPTVSYLSISGDGQSSLHGSHGSVIFPTGLVGLDSWTKKPGTHLFGEEMIFLESPAVKCSFNFSAEEGIFGHTVETTGKVTCSNVYWNDGSTIGGKDSVWYELIYMLNLYNSHTHTTDVYVPGQSDTQTVEIEAVSGSDELTVGRYNENAVWEPIATGVLQNAIKVYKDVELNVPAQTITVELGPPEQQMWYKENS